MPAKLENSAVAKGLEKVTLHSRVSALGDHTIVVIWVMKIFLYSSSVYSCHFFLISSAFVRSIPFVLYYAHHCMKCSLGISNFLEEISSLSHSIVLLYFFALITEEGFLTAPCYFWNSAFKWVYLFCFLLCL